eukprot:gb/GEZN01007581.1/.p1 GENE.gb/GEZN01007581.1/~~gb/GEZN01007581.1/.p1  ORF type:complete len:443 (-),score=59.93 gb/GEZN01007581.1/:121-1449(-)
MSMELVSSSTPPPLYVTASLDLHHTPRHSHSQSSPSTPSRHVSTAPDFPTRSEMALVQPSSSSTPLKNVEEGKEVLDFRNRLVYLRYSTVLAAICHIFVSVIVLSMGFSRGGIDPYTGKQLYLSASLVTFGFGCLNTTVFALVEAWQILEGTSDRKDFPSWNWHNDSFLNSVGNMFFLSAFLLPAVITYMMHARGLELWEVLLLRSSAYEHKLFDVIIMHMITGIAVFVIDVLSIVNQSNKLHSFQQRDNDEDKGEGEAEEDEDNDDDNEDEIRPVAVRDRRLAIASLVVHFVFLVDLSVITGYGANLHEGVTVSTIVFALLLTVWLYFTIKYRNLADITESWLLKNRLATIFHLFAFLCCFWLAFAIVMFEQEFSTGFFGTLSSIGHLPIFQCSILLMFFVIYIVLYFVILYVHSRSMRSLDEIASLFLAAKLQARLLDDN